MSEKLESALRQALKTTLPDFDQKTKYENVAFDPKGKGSWLAFWFLPNQPEVDTLGAGGSDHVDGLVQIDINLPTGAGKTGLDTITDALGSAFTAGARFSYDSVVVKINNAGRVGPGQLVDGFYRYIYRISWEAWTPRA